LPHGFSKKGLALGKLGPFTDWSITNYSTEQRTPIKRGYFAWILDVNFGFRFRSRNYIIYKQSELDGNTPNIEKQGEHTNGIIYGKTTINKSV
jgi:hypothetical protein